MPPEVKAQARKALLATAGAGICLALGACAMAPRPQARDASKASYADHVWPPPPDEARIRLEAILYGRADVEADSKLQRVLIGATPEARFDRLRKPFAVAFDPSGRILVTDPGLGALLRFDREGRRMDVIGTTGSLHLKTPLGLCVGSDGTIYVADAALARVVAFDAEGELKTAYGKQGELKNPTDAALSPDGSRLYVADSKGNKVAVFDAKAGSLVHAFGKSGQGEGEFRFPTSVAFSRDGFLLVVDQINARVQVFDAEGEYMDQVGQRGVTGGSFVRPKDIVVDDVGWIYVSDGAFNNFQLFDRDFNLLTYVGDGGSGPGQFQVATGIAVRGPEIAMVDQLGRRVQLFRFLHNKE